MKRIIYLATIFFLLLAAVTPVAASPTASGLPGALNQATEEKLYLPLTVVNPATVTVSGRLISDQANYVPDSGPATVTTDIPLADIVIQDTRGNSTTTDSQGRYSFQAAVGSQIAPQSENYYFYPSYITVNANQLLNNLDFTGAAPQQSATVALGRPEAQEFPNPSFETVPYYWNPISGNAAGWTPGYSTAAAHTGTHSGFTGIPSGYYNLVESWSRWRSHEIFIPATPTLANVTLWIRTGTTEAAMAAAEDAQAQTEALAADLKQIEGWNTEDPNLPQLAAVKDFYYVSVIRLDNSVIATPYSAFSSNTGWTQINVSLAAYAGQWVKLEFGTNNNTNGYPSWAYFDDVELSLDTALATCTQVLVNSNFETPGAGWLYKSPQTIPPKYTTLDFFSPLISMQAGTAPWEAELGENTTTEFFQPFTLPANTTFAQLRMVVRPRSSGWYGWYSEQAKPNLEPLADIGEPYSPESPTQMESQYAYIADSNGYDGLYLLFKYFSIDTSWLARSYNITYLPKNVPYSVLFGVGSMDWRRTSLFVDEVYLDVCTP